MTSRTLFASFVSSTGLDKLFARQIAAPPPLQTRQCQICPQDALPCRPCAAATETALLQSAQNYTSYNKLDSFLTSDRQLIAVQSSAFLSELGGTITNSLLVTSYVSADQSRSALIYYSESFAGQLASFAVEYSQRQPTFGYYMNDGEEIIQSLPPYQPVASSQQVPATPQQNASLTSVRAGSGCATRCEILCTLGDFIFCAAGQVIKYCLPALATGPEGLAVTSVCAIVVSFNCGLADAPLCSSPCEQWCKCLGKAPCASAAGGCCGTCEECTSTGCMPIQCPSGYSCSNTSGTCSCDNFCGSVCCPAGQCVNGQCVFCPSGEVACVPTYGSGSYTCCDASNICCQLGSSSWCIGSTDSCCGLGGACAPLATCCASAAGLFACCATGVQQCCQDSSSPYCCPSSCTCHAGACLC
jgi:hypothetical protein